jgi:hypothetical protein
MRENRALGFNCITRKVVVAVRNTVCFVVQ